MGLEDPFGDAPGDLEDINLGVDDAGALGHTTVMVACGRSDGPVGVREFDKAHIKSVGGEPIVIGMAFVNHGDRTVALPKAVIPFREVLDITMNVDPDHMAAEGVTADGVGF